MALRIGNLAVAHPAYGCNRHAVRLALGRIRVSAITISTLLDDRGLGTRVERWLAREAKNAGMAIQITPEPAASLEKLDRRFEERHAERAAPGELLSTDTVVVADVQGIEEVYRPAVVATFGFRTLGFLHAAEQPAAAVARRHDVVLPVDRNLERPFGAVLTNNGHELCGIGKEPREPDFDGIEHRRAKVRTPEIHGPPRPSGLGPFGIGR